MSAHHNPRKSRVMQTATAINAFASRARTRGAKPLAVKLQTSYRTVENWIAGRTGPNWTHVATMLNDDALACDVLRAAGRDDIAELVEARGHAIELARLMRKAGGHDS